MRLQPVAKVKPFVLEAMSRREIKLIGYNFPGGPAEYDPSTQVASGPRGFSMCPSSASTSTAIFDHDKDTKKDD